MIEITEIIVRSLLKTNRQQYKMAAAFTSDFVAKVSIGKCPDDRGCLSRIVSFSVPGISDKWNT